uniref:O-methyltransferase domain-containing protein n=1 Tax=Physcomitrium patens TaxID=3218 RepID=A0A7I4DYJ5_PHYPA
MIARLSIVHLVRFVSSWIVWQTVILDYNVKVFTEFVAFFNLLMAEATARSSDVDHKDCASAAQNGMRVLSPLLFGHAAAMTLKTAVVLNIPDILARAEPERGALSVHEISKELPSDSVDEQVLHRVMRTLVHLKVFSAERVSESGTTVARYGLTPASRRLVQENNSRSLAPLLMYLNYISSHVPWQHLHESVLYGKDAWGTAYGMTSWEYSDVDPEYGALWNAFNKVQGAPTIEALKRYDGFKDVNVLVDVGGYQGATVAAIVAAHPHIRGINFDLPHVIAEAPEFPGICLP